LLNTDAFPENDWLSNLIAVTERNPDFSSFSSRQINAGNTRFLDGAGDVYHVSGFAWKRYLDYPSEDYGKETKETFSPCAAAALYSREAFLEVGGFDEDLFSYYEDVDLGFRLRLAGYRSLYVADAVVAHVGSGTMGAQSDFAFYYCHRNLVWIFFTNMPFPYLWLYLPAHIMTNLIYLIFYTLKGRGGILWKAKWDALRGISTAFQKRKGIQSRRRVNPSNLIGIMEHGFFKPFSRDYQLRRALRKANEKGT
jgi:GT2 family glycosyltransferase